MLLGSLAVAPLALLLTAAPPLPPVPIVRAEEPSTEAASRLRFGVALDVGLPSGIELTPYVRPLSWLQLEAALAHDGAAFGLGGGLTVGALAASFTPTLSLDVGHFFRGDVTGGLSQVVGVDLSRYGSAKQFDFDHVELQAGFLFGWPGGQLFLRGGVGYVRSTLHDFVASLQTATGDATLTAADPTLSAWVPSGRAGVLVNF